MAEPSRIQLQMMLVQQAGPGALPLSILAPQAFLPFLRQVEQLAIEEKIRPVLVYWSRQSAARLLPTGQRFHELLRDADCVCIFSEDRKDTSDEWCFLLESRGLCLVVYGHQAMESPDGEKYQCVGSMDPTLVKQAFDRLIPIWQQLDLAESHRLEDKRAALGPTGSAPPYLNRMKSAWPIVKAPIQTSVILDPLHSASGEAYDAILPPTGDGGEPKRVQPILVDNGPGQAPISPIGGGSRGGKTAMVPSAKTQAVGVDDILEAAAIDLLHPNFDSEHAESGSGPVATPSDETTDDNGKSGSKHDAKTQEDAEEPPALIPPDAQAIISEIVGRLRHSSDLSSILQYAIETLVEVSGAERGLIWQIEGDHLRVTNEYATSGYNQFIKSQLTPQESTAIVLDFLSRFPDETGAGVISIPNTSKDTHLHKVSPTLSSLIELGGVQARLMAQLRSRGIFSGFLELQQCHGPREWSTTDAVVIQRVAEVLSVVVQQSADRAKIEMDAQEMTLVNEIASLFRESRGVSTRQSLVKSVMLVAEHMGFAHSEIYLFDKDKNELLPQMQDVEHNSISLDDKTNPFMEVFQSGRQKIVNSEYSRKPDPFFKNDMALVLPLISEGTRLGVIGLWQRANNRQDFRLQDRELGLTIAGHLSNVIRADQAIQQIRADQARAALINRVSSEIRNALKRADQIMETLVEALHEYFKLDLCVCSLFDENTDSFRESKAAGSRDGGKTRKDSPLDSGEEVPQNLGEQLFEIFKDDLKDGETIFVTKDEIESKLNAVDRHPDMGECKSATLVPLFYAGNFKAALCLVSPDQIREHSEKDMHMILDLADRVAVVISHAELFAQVEIESITDPMTGLFNRRHFETQLGKEIDRYQRFGHAFSFIIIDLDFLKKINDTLGHQFGDEAIKHIGAVLKKSVRDVDTVGRFGGEEFVVLLPETDLKWARMVAERICTSIREKPVEGVGTVTASLGVAIFPHDADDKEKLFELADAALYLAKSRGRDQVCTVSDDLNTEEGQVALTNELKKKVDAERYGNDAEAEAAKDSSSSLDVKEAVPAFDLDMVADKGILGMLAQIVKTLEEKDAYGAERSPRVYGFASKMAHSLHLSKEHAEIVSLSAVLCNLGKIAVPEEVLKKEGPLTEEELALVREAPSRGAKLLEPTRLLYRVSQIIEACREHWDGTGYPGGLRGPDIPVESQIVSLVDSYVAMTSDRPYRKALSQKEAIREIQAGAGKKWDSRLVKIFLSLIQKESK